MRRRTFVQSLIVAACAAAIPRALLAQSTPEAAALWQARIRSILGRGRLPIVDVEATYQSGTDLERMIGLMDRHDVAQIAFAPANAPSGQPSLDLHKRHADRFIPTTSSGEFPRWWNDPIAFLAVVKRDLATKQYALMGEHEFRHYPSPEQVEAGQAQRDITIPIDGPAGHALFKLGEETGIAFQIHYEVEDRLLPSLEAMLTRYPQAKAIWCHLGMVRYPDRAKLYGPAYVQSLIARFPSLHFDLAVPPPNYVYRPSGVRDSTLYRDGKLDPAWRDVIESSPEHFLAASDYRLPVESKYGETIERTRALILTALSEPTRHLAAYGNAWRLITGATWNG